MGFSFSAAHIAILRSLVAERDPATLFEQAAAQAARLVGADGAALIEVVADDEMRYRFFQGLPSDHQKMAADLRFSYRGTTSGLALESGRPIFNADYAAHPKAMPQFVASGLRANLAVPCGPAQIGSAVLAIAWFDNKPDGAPHPQALELIMLIADLMYAALYRQSLEDDLARQAKYDDLTGLPNRRFLASHLRNGRLPPHPGHQTAVALLDLDDFKKVNDSFGHGAGDEILRALASRLKLQLGANDIAVRMGGDEFVLVLSRNHDDLPWATRFDQLSTALNLPYTLNADNTILCRSSIGVALDVNRNTPLDDLIRQADAALYRLKREKLLLVPSWQSE